MITKRGKGDFARIYRPCRISEVYGQEGITKIVGRGLDEGNLPYSMLFYGESGVGKTTIARIIAMGINCRPLSPTSEPCLECDSCRQAMNDNHFAFKQINSAELTGVDRIRRIVDDLCCAAMDDSKHKIVVFDECHRIWKPAQDLLLKVVEDNKQDNYFILCTTEPKSVLETLKNRCMPIQFKPIEDQAMFDLLTDICESERLVCPDEILERVIEEAKGKARIALYLLQKMAVSGEIESLPSAVDQAVNLVRAAFGR
jgi:DNA polymerase-3 subunit gamma/tau